jgi:hypothetical protein
MVAVACLAENCSYASQTEYQNLTFDVALGLTFDGPTLSVDFSTPGWGITLDDRGLERAAANYDAGGANRLLLDAPAFEPQFVPGY